MLIVQTLVGALSKREPPQATGKPTLSIFGLKR